MTNSNDHDEKIILGKIVGVHGIKGLVKLFSYTSPREGILKYTTIYLRLNQKWVKSQLFSGSVRGKHVTAHISHIATREEGLAMKDVEIAINQSQLDCLKTNEHYWRDLEGLTVITTTAINLGQIQWLFDVGSNDVMVVKGEKEHFLPWVMGDVVQSVDMTLKQVIVAWDPDF